LSLYFTPPQIELFQTSETVKFSFEYFDKQKGKQVRVYRGTGCAQCPDKKLCTKSKRGPRRIKCYGNEANLREMAEKMESPEGQEVYRVRREFLTRGLQGVMAEFSLAFIAHNLKRIWTIKSQTKAIGVNPTKNGRIDHSSLKNLGRSIKGVWAQILSSFSKGLSIYQL
jgi:hypothetical protein